MYVWNKYAAHLAEDRAGIFLFVCFLSVCGRQNHIFRRFFLFFSVKGTGRGKTETKDDRSPALPHTEVSGNSKQ